MRIGSSSTSASLMYYALHVLGDFRAFPVFVMVKTLFATLAAVPFTPLLTGSFSKHGSILWALMADTVEYGECRATRASKV